MGWEVGVKLVNQRVRSEEMMSLKPHRGRAPDQFSIGSAPYVEKKIVCTFILTEYI